MPLIALLAAYDRPSGVTADVTFIVKRPPAA